MRPAASASGRDLSPGTDAASVPPARWSLAVHCAAVAAAATALYANALSAPFVFDDEANIVLPGRVHALDLSPRSLAPALQGFPIGRWLANLTFAVNHALGRLDPTGYHVVNVAIHAATAIVVLLLAREILARAGGLDVGGRERAALFTALLFAVHPIQTQAVTYVVQRMTSLGALFAFLALLAYLRGRAATGPARAIRLAAGAVASYLAFACKETYAVLPLLAILLEALCFPGLVDRVRRHAAAVAAGAAALAALAALAAVTWWGTLAAELPRYGVTVGARLLTQPRVLWHYLSLLALPLPSRLHIDYAWTPSTGLLSPPSTLAALAGLVALCAIAVAAATRRRAPLLAFAIAWFLAALCIEQTVLPLHFAFEHRLYPASFGLFLLAGAAAERGLSRLSVERWLLAGPVLAALALATVLRNAAWNDPVALYADPAGYRAGEIGNLLTLGRVLMFRGELQQAEEVLQRARSLDPENPGPLVNLAGVAEARRDLDGAVGLYRRALRMNPRISAAWYGAAWGLYALGRIDEAEAAAREGLARDPSFTPLRVPIAACLERRGDRAAAVAELEQALRTDPGLWVAWLNLAQLHLADGRGGDALAAIDRYVTALPDDARGHAFRGRILAAVGRRAEARAALSRAVALDPRDEDARRALAALDAP